MVWIASRSTGGQLEVLGVFPSLEQAEQSVEQHAGRPVTWVSAAGASRTGRCATGCASYEIARAEPRSWQLQCADCAATWAVTAAGILAANDWLVCPRCHAVAGDHPVA